MIVSIILSYCSIKDPTTDPQLIELTKQINRNLESIDKKLEVLRIGSRPKFLKEAPQILKNTKSNGSVEKDNAVRLKNKNKAKGKQP